MAKIYYKRIKAGLMAIEGVPPLWRAQVQKMLDTEQGKQTQRLSVYPWVLGYTDSFYYQEI